MPYIMVDVEADGPCPGLYSMVSFAAVLVKPGLNTWFKGELKPISKLYTETALQIIGLTREQTLKFNEPRKVMREFATWLNGVDMYNKGRLMFISDNNGFDWQFLNYYFWTFYTENPFGHSSINLGSLYKGLIKNMYKNFKHLRKTKHTHDPLDDAFGNAEAMLTIGRRYNIEGMSQIF